MFLYDRVFRHETVKDLLNKCQRIGKFPLPIKRCREILLLFYIIQCYLNPEQISSSFHLVNKLCIFLVYRVLDSILQTFCLGLNATSNNIQVQSKLLYFYQKSFEKLSYFDKLTITTKRQCHN